MPKNLMLLLIATTSLLACRHDNITLEANPSEVACGETVRLTWAWDEDSSTGEIIISANPPVGGLPMSLPRPVEPMS